MDNEIKLLRQKQKEEEQQIKKGRSFFKSVISKSTNDNVNNKDKSVENKKDEQIKHRCYKCDSLYNTKKEATRCCKNKKHNKTYQSNNFDNTFDNGISGFNILSFLSGIIGIGVVVMVGFYVINQVNYALDISTTEQLNISNTTTLSTELFHSMFFIVFLIPIFLILLKHFVNDIRQ